MILFNDTRYTVTKEFCGHPQEMYVFRFANDFVNCHKTLQEAEKAAIDFRCNIYGLVDKVEKILPYYLESLAWSNCLSLDNGEVLEHANANSQEFSNQAKETAKNFILKFLALAPIDCLEWARDHSWSDLGHDLALTQNRHGAGFWDRGAGAIGKRLTESAEKLGEVNLWATDENSLIEIE